MTEQDAKIQQLSDRVTSLELESFDTTPITDPRTTANLQQTISIPYTTTLPTYSPTLNGYRVIYFDGSNYWLYIWANGGWRSQQLGSGGGSSGVTQITQGTNITISPVGGTGNVTVNATVTDVSIATVDVTTNNVSTSKHGFAPKAPNNTTQFLRADATWAAPASSSFVVTTGGDGSRALNTASGNQVIAHGLGKTPTKVFCSAGAYTANGSKFCQSQATWWTSGNNNLSMYYIPNAAGGMNATGEIIYLLEDGTNGSKATLTVDATNLTFAWTKVGAAAATPIFFYWEASA